MLVGGRVGSLPRKILRLDRVNDTWNGRPTPGSRIQFTPTTLNRGGRHQNGGQLGSQGEIRGLCDSTVYGM